MTPNRHYVTVMVHRDGALKSHKMRIPIWFVRFAGGAALVLVVLIVLGAALYVPLARTAARVPGLARDVERLEADNARVVTLARALDQAEERYDQLRTMLGGDLVTPIGDALSSDLAVAAIYAGPPEASRHYEPGPSIPRHWPLGEIRGFITRGVVLPGGSDEPHRGIDIAVPAGTPVRTAGGGTVVDAGADPEYGLFVLLQHPGGYETMYGHASRLLVSRGDSVEAGEVIALVGSTGRSTAPHLHFEIRRGGRVIDDPMSMLEEGK